MANVDLNINVGVTPKNIFENISNQIKALEGQIQGIGGAFKSAIGAFAAIKAAAGTFDFIIDATRQTEDLTNQFVRFTGSVEEAEKQLNALRNIPGPSLEELAEANRTLLAFGSSTEESIKQLKQLNDVAAANGAKISDLAEIYGKIQQEGSLSAETFKKLGKEIAGFSTDFSKALGVPEKSLKSLAEQGQITSDQVAEAFRKLTEAGGKYFGASERQAQTLTGSLSALNDAFTHLASSLGKSANPLLTKFINLLAEAAEGNARANEELERLANQNEAQKRIQSIGDELEGLNEKLKDLKDQQSEGFSFFGDDQIELKDKIDQVALAIQNLSRERLKLVKQEGLADTFKRDAAAADVLRKANEKASEEAQAARAAREAKALDESVKQAEARGQKLLDLDRQLNRLREQQAITTAEKIRLINEQAVRDEMENTARIRGQVLSGEAQLALEQQRLLNQQQVEAITARETAITAQIVEANAQRLEINLQADEAEKSRFQAKYDELETIQAKAEADRIAIARKARVDEFNLEKITAQASVNWEKMTWQQRVETTQVGLNAIAGLMSSGNRSLFEAGKAAALASAAIAIPSIAIKTYESLVGFGGPFVAAAGAALAVAAQGVHLARISAAQPARFAEGGVVPGVGNKDTVPALLTPGEVVVPKQNFDELSQNFALGAIANDQVQLMTQSNALQAKILEQITQGAIIEKMAIMIGLLEDIKTFSRSGGGSGLDIPAIDPVPAIPPTSVRNSQERVIDYKRVDDRRA